MLAPGPTRTWPRRSAALACLLGLAPTGCGADADTEPPPTVEPVVLADPPPPPISGGTMLLAKDGSTVVAGDPDRDRVWIVDVEGRVLKHKIVLESGDEPGRVIEGPPGRVHVVLRRGNAVVSVDLSSGKIVERRAVCASPRGIAYEEATDPEGGNLHVACAGGTLVTLPAMGGEPSRKVRLDADLRDVLVGQSGVLFVSRFRSAEVLSISPAGEVLGRMAAQGFTLGDAFEAGVARRMLAWPKGNGVAVLHQRAKASPIEIAPGAYTEGQCQSAVVHGTISLFDASGSSGLLAKPPSGSYIAGVLPIDAAVSDDGEVIAVVTAGDNLLRRVPANLFEGAIACDQAYAKVVPQELPGQPISVVFDGLDRIVVQLREPAGLVILDRTSNVNTSTPIWFGAESRRDTGHDMFHKSPNPNAVIACALCHVEAGDDGRVWNFKGIGERRTQNLWGGILSTAPFHWDGSLKSFGALVHDTMVTRMGGEQPDDAHVEALARWLDAVPLPSRDVGDADTIKRGADLYESLSCIECHKGAKLTDNRSLDVGTGGKFQVPSLLAVGLRPPYLHDGCAKTLRDRFIEPCATADHGDTAGLTDSQIDDLVAFLNTL